MAVPGYNIPGTLHVQGYLEREGDRSTDTVNMITRIQRWRRELGFWNEVVLKSWVLKCYSHLEKNGI
jgi:hypothetical protein